MISLLIDNIFKHLYFKSKSLQGAWFFASFFHLTSEILFFKLFLLKLLCFCQAITFISLSQFVIIVNNIINNVTTFYYIFLTVIVSAEKKLSTLVVRLVKHLIGGTVFDNITLIHKYYLKVKCQKGQSKLTLNFCFASTLPKQSTGLFWNSSLAEVIAL